MAKRRRFVPECPTGASLEGRIAPSSIGDWFTSQYNQIKLDLHITHKPNPNAAAGIEQLWKDSKELSKPHPAGHAHAQPAQHAKVK